jgi:beta-glucosidase
VSEDGRGPSIWDTYARTPGKIHDGSNGDVAADHYRRYREDVELMRRIGAAAYRFSIAWPRVFPQGIGRPNPKGLDFYERLVDALLQAGIAPYPTLYHWDLPQALQDRGGWQSRDTARAFADYAGHVAARLSDRVRDFFTMNEFFSFVDLGHRGIDEVVDGKPIRIELAPGLRLPPRELNQVRHHAVLAQGLSVQAIRASGRPGTRCGPADNLATAVPLLETPEHVRAAETATRDINAAYLGVMLEGRYPEGYLRWTGADAPRFTDEDLRAIGSPVDFVGINVYRPAFYARPSERPPGWEAVPFAASHPRTASSWHLIAPESIYWAVRHAHALWRPKSIFITENGCGAADAVGPDGRVHDTDRVAYLRAYMAELRRATAEGVPVNGCFQWSLMDNFEWADGYKTRFGLVHVDFSTQKRTPKASADWFREAARRNAVV